MNYFKRNLITSLFILIGSLYFSDRLDSQISTLQGDDVEGDQLRSIIVESWETEPWEVEAIPGPPAGLATTKLVAGQPKNLSNNTKNLKSLGIRFNFVYPGNNSVILTPPKTRSVRKVTGQLDEKNQPKYIDIPGIELPGRVEAMSVWVLGRGNNAFLEGWIEDWRGDTHIYKFGSINFIGWRPLKIKIPNSVPQRISSFPQTKSIIFKKFVIRTDPSYPQEEVVMFLDSLKVLTTIYDLHFDGVGMDFDERDKQFKSKVNEYQKQLIQKNQDN